MNEIVEQLEAITFVLSLIAGILLGFVCIFGATHLRK